MEKLSLEKVTTKAFVTQYTLLKFLVPTTSVAIAETVQLYFLLLPCQQCWPAGKSFEWGAGCFNKT